MTGTIPKGAKLGELYYMDLGRNKFSGTLPTFEGYDEIRHLHLDFNKFTGTLPSSVINAGEGKLVTLSVNDNHLTGAIPGDHIYYEYLVQFTTQHNNFTKMNFNSCKLEVFSYGDLVEFGSDCDICNCRTLNSDRIMCDFCWDD